MNFLTKHITPIIISYLVILLLLHILPINGKESSLNNNYTIGIRLDYIGHFAAFGLLAFLANIYARLNNRNLVITNILVLTISASLETLQYFLPYRTFNLNDLLANGIGIGLGIVAGVVLVKGKIMKNSGFHFPSKH